VLATAEVDVFLLAQSQDLLLGEDAVEGQALVLHEAAEGGFEARLGV
jgi:hypothetical protein